MSFARNEEDTFDCILFSFLRSRSVTKGSSWLILIFFSFYLMFHRPGVCAASLLIVYLQIDHVFDMLFAHRPYALRKADETAFRRGGQLGIYLICSRRQPTRGIPQIWELELWLTTLNCKMPAWYKTSHKIFDGVILNWNIFSTFFITLFLVKKNQRFGSWLCFHHHVKLLHLLGWFH